MIHQLKSKKRNIEVEKKCLCGQIGRIASTYRMKLITCQEIFRYETLYWSAGIWNIVSDKIGMFH